jgi:hypothetical protein
VELSESERDLLLSALFELSITRAKDDERREQAKALARKLGGDPEALFFGAGESESDVERLADLPRLNDEADGIYYPHAIAKGDEAETQQMLAALLADCVTNGRHHLATLDHPHAGMVIGCTHCHRYWRTGR